MGMIREYSPILEILRVAKKNWKDNKDNSLHLGRKYARIFVLGPYLFLVAHSFRSRKTVRLSEKIMSAEIYPSIFLCQMETIVYIYIGERREVAIEARGNEPS